MGAPDGTLTAVLEQARTLGFLGPGPVANHVEHAVAFLDLLEDGPGAEGPFVDLGSGGGVPGLVLATLLPRSRWVLLDSMVRRTRFLDVAVAALGLEDRVEVVTARAEAAGRDPGRRGAHRAVVARSFAAPPVLAECAAPLLRPGGTVIVSEPPAEADADGPRPGRWPRAGLAEVGLALDHWVAGPPSLIRLRAEAGCPRRFPRPTGVPGKQPLW
ncbi:MAG: RsmG family class I SAM-dependent methyltransferase [Acidimicrobiales bacterium]